MIILIIILLITLGIVIWGGVTSWRFIGKNKDFYENLKRANDLELPILYINLEHRKDRRKEIEEEMNKLKNINLVRIDAPKTERGIVGCQLGHITALSVFIKTDWSYALIVEDDFMWHDVNKAPKIIDKLIKNRDKWDIVLFSCGSGSAEKIKTDLPIKKVEGCQTTSSYLITKNYAKKLRDFWVNNIASSSKNKLFNLGVDTALDIVWKQLQARDVWYCTDPLLGKQRKSFSDIEKKEVNYNV